MRSDGHERRGGRESAAGRGGPLWRWFVGNSLVAGVLALGWLVLRTGTRPSRLAYQCQQAALATATAALGAPLVGLVLAVRRRLTGGMTGAGAAVAAVAAAVTGIGLWGVLVGVDASPRPVAAAPADVRSAVFHVASCPEDPAGDRFPGLDRLVELMGHGGLRLYRSAATSLVAGPDGLIGADDVVVVKINYQWAERGGTNTDLLRGLLRALLDHPDGFTGEIVVGENTQFASHSGFDRSSDNAQDAGLSPLDVVDGYRVQGHAVSLVDWKALRFTEVGEYSDGDAADGYVVLPEDPVIGGSVSYPKFQTTDGTFVSLRHGVWDPGTASYDRGRLRLINLPVLKSHHATYGLTACVKNWMGVVTTGLGTGAHSATRYGLLGATMAVVRPADLNILDAIWVNADPTTGPASPPGRTPAPAPARAAAPDSRARAGRRSRPPRTRRPG